ncbi:MAG: S41 family peptidase [Lachnospiraceae bacterium]|nr:S41 family peptidase [Lachnospiraceae bacterium]
MEEQQNQISVEYASQQIKKARKKGLVQGLLIALGCFFITVIIISAVSIIQMIVNGSFYARMMGSTSSPVLDKKSIDKIDSLYGLIENTYLEDVDKEQIRDGIYKGILESLDDPYSVYYNQEEFAEMMEDTSGTFEGIGVYLTQDPDTKDIIVVRPIKDSPAQKAGMLADDIVVEVDGEDVAGQDLNLVVSKMRGPKDTMVNVGVKREGSDDIIRFDIKRGEINALTVDYEMLDDRIGYIAISEFADATDDQFREAIDSLEGDGMKALIIDLRSNGGGFVDSSVEVADRLVKEGVIVSVKDKRGLSYRYEDEGDENYLKVPCVVLVDGNTASASEILTGALKDHGLVTVMGTKTFGKGITQIITSLDDGSGVKITNSKYYTPNGENIHEIGIEPDVEVEFDYDRYKKDGYDNQLEAAKDYLRDKIK